jgi:UDP-glucose 4-epimerase
MKVLVTGGAGFIGSWLSRKILSNGNQVIVVDNLSTGKRENIPTEAEFIYLDLSDERNLRELPQGIDLVYHLASQASGEVSFEDPVHDLRANSLATLALLRWAREYAVGKFIFTSTMGVYKDHLGFPADETSPVCPKSFYSVNKRASEGFLRIFSEEGMRTTVLRLFNVYGPGQNMKNLKQGMISIYMAYIAQRKPILVKGPLERFRDFVFVDDVVDALIASQAPSADGKTYNVCTGRKTTVKEVLEIIVKAFGSDPNTYPIEIVERTPRDIDGCYGNFGKIMSDLGWRPSVSLEEGIGKMVASLQVGVSVEGREI